MAVCYSLLLFGIFFLFWDVWTKKYLTTLDNAWFNRIFTKQYI
jgi:hypothetical protein